MAWSLKSNLRGEDGHLLFASCASQAAATVKVAQLAGGQLPTPAPVGTAVCVRFDNGSDADVTLLNVGGTSAPVTVSGVSLASRRLSIEPQSVCHLVYDGESWCLVSCDRDVFAVDEAGAAIEALSARVEAVERTVSAGSVNAADALWSDGAAVSSGSAIKPVYFADGKPAETWFTVETSVPKGAKFTDTTYDPIAVDEVEQLFS